MTAPMAVLVTKDPRDPNLGVPHEQRLGECCQFAAQYQMANDGLLCHGSIYREGVSTQRIGHAFVITTDGGVFEPTLGVWFPHWEIYLRWASAEIDAIYNREEAAFHVLRSGNYGHWHEDASGVWGGDG